jgi:hypothetical protein
MMERLSVLRAGNALSSETSCDTYFCYRLSKPQVHIAAGRIGKLKKNSITSSGLEPATFQLLAERFNHQGALLNKSLAIELS